MKTTHLRRIMNLIAPSADATDAGITPLLRAHLDDVAGAARCNCAHHSFTKCAQH